MAKKRTPCWLEIGVGAAGFAGALRALEFADSWIHVQIALGRDPSVDEVAEWWNLSRRTAFRCQASFRQCFPSVESPASLYAGNPKALESAAKSVRRLSKVAPAERTRATRSDTDLLKIGLLRT